MAYTLSDTEYNDLMAKVDNFDHALRRIAILVEPNDGDYWTDEAGILESVSDTVEALKAEGYLG